jgi:hypothetical protein
MGLTASEFANLSEPQQSFLLKEKRKYHLFALELEASYTFGDSNRLTYIAQ